MNAGRTARERARAELTEEIKTAARQQLATVGAEALSLRAISRELGMVSSALYRYFASRDELLTALIIDAYDALGAAAEAAPAGGDPVDDWIAIYAAVRDWARANPQEYALIYGSPISGYQAPQTTVQPASRVPLLLLGLLQRAQESGRLVTPPDAPTPSGALAQQTEVLVALAPGVPPAVLVRTVIVWTQLFGMLSFELFGQLVGSMDPADEFFASASRQMAAFVGLS
ncbi:TetR/AcrR family transcriptional regulator [Kribbella speibonae]|uniref:TetR/AcrR family transcriptional regulator n=1 Tax=Kribbella speibonae TaxID=1572660 RepID=A0A4V2M5M5_9ACTN|nr:TetR/AcrR family transcriptional regulator [Kribbella speibonae]TCC18776.1 TetR/AcrR family transcriptional regulator [Kribbella speibonae]TCC40362.1 TetR/AcrR family transcriptional regulator [Kribbella speibonae]